MSGVSGLTMMSGLSGLAEQVNHDLYLCPILLGLEQTAAGSALADTKPLRCTSNPRNVPPALRIDLFPRFLHALRSE